MNYRDYKQYGQGEFYHIYNRGNARGDIFLDEQDYSFFLLRLKQNLFPEINSKLRIQPLPANSFSLLCYCLMPNHFHLLLKQNKEINPSKLLLKLCTSYSMYFNKKYNQVGHIFQDSFKQVNIDEDSYLNWLSCYIHQNPKVAGLIENLEDYKWSSYPEFIGKSFSNLCSKEIVLDKFKNRDHYKNFVSDSFQIIKNKREIGHLFLD